MYIGLVAGAFKPFQRGHYALVKKAADENDTVHLFVSTGDRIKKGQVPIMWKQMRPIWNKYIKKVLPGNVKVHYAPNPTTALFDVLIDAEERSPNGDTYQFYADESDIKRYDNPKVREKTLPNLFANDQIEFRPLKRSLTAGVSGTKVRQSIADGDLAAFTSMMPEPLRPKADILFRKLGGKPGKKII